METLKIKIHRKTAMHYAKALREQEREYKLTKLKAETLFDIPVEDIQDAFKVGMLFKEVSLNHKP